MYVCLDEVTWQHWLVEGYNDAGFVSLLFYVCRGSEEVLQFSLTYAIIVIFI